MDEGWRTTRVLRRQLLVWAAVAVLAWVGVVAAVSARAASDDPTPFDVTAAGIAFPAPLVAHGHVNVRLVDGRSFGLHLDPNPDQPGAAWIGASFVPWSALGVVDGCVAWVQWSGADEHFGEAGQDPVCLTTQMETPCPSPSPTPTPTRTSTPRPSVSPSSSASPTSQPTGLPSPTLQPTPAPSDTPSASPSSSPSPSAHPSVLPSPTSAPTATGGPGPVSPSPSSTSAPVQAELAVTGASSGVLFVIAVLLVMTGVIVWGLHRRGGVR
ncbi:hypothetical protein Celgi_1332 [Cellulomonas gilvus ATCC 13127]|uniref:LPXTG-motif cell wall anchor domain protein n=1 Tax=Cellulomonas gilvus (strain ATCC 13127 / NRRL B-14078) TaxID=593907 RepID=F8A2Z6_CELGA|nr:hypothetical protein Celgi_1332 [Cellulomonas gilvus ATCC 13127]